MPSGTKAPGTETKWPGTVCTKRQNVGTCLDFHRYECVLLKSLGTYVIHIFRVTIPTSPLVQKATFFQIEFWLLDWLGPRPMADARVMEV
jgi:hypothetical protein